MAYEPKEWVCGETVTAEALNNLEEGVQEALECCEGGGGGSDILVVNYHADSNYNVTCDKAFTEIKNAYDNNQPIIARVKADFIAGVTLTATSVEYLNDYIEQFYFSFVRAYSCSNGYGLQEFHVAHDDSENITPGYGDIVICNA